MGSIRTSVLQVNPRVEEAARSLGRTPAQVYTSITFPLVRPGLLSGAALVFLLTMKELAGDADSAAHGVSHPGPPQSGARPRKAFFAQAAAPALLLVLASSVPLAFLMLRERR